MSIWQWETVGAIGIIDGEIYASSVEKGNLSGVMLTFEPSEDANQLLQRLNKHMKLAESWVNTFEYYVYADPYTDTKGQLLENMAAIGMVKLDFNTWEFQN